MTRSRLALLAIPWLATSANAAHLTAVWKNNISGNWSDFGNWTLSPAQNAFPDNGADTFDATVGLTGSPSYTVTLNTAVTVDNLTLGGTNSTISQTGAVNVLKTLTVSSGTFDLAGGTLTTAAANLTGGVLKLSGGSLTPTDITLGGGTILGGTITSSGAGKLRLTNVSTNTLDGVNVVGGLALDLPNGRIRLRNDTQFTTASITGSVAVLSFEGTSSDHTALLENVTINLDGASGYMSLDGAAPVVTVAATSVIRGRGNISHSQLTSVTGTAQLVNQGLISSDLAGQNFVMTPPVITNGGTLRAIGGAALTINSASFTNSPGGILSATGGSSLTLQQGWHNHGSLVLQDTSVFSMEGNFTTTDLGLAGWNRSGGTVKLAGTLDNSGSTLALDSASGSIQINGGIIKGGAITQTAAAKMVFPNASANALDGASVTGGLWIDQANGRLRLRNDSVFSGGATLTGNTAILSFEATAADSTAHLADTVNLDGTACYVSLDGPSPALTIGSTGVIRGRGVISHSQLVSVSGISQLINQGLLSADVAGQTLTLGVHSLVNAGVLEAKNGSTFNLSSALASQAGGTFRLVDGNLQITSSVAGPDFSIGASGRLTGYGEVRLNNPATDSLALAGTLDPSPGVSGLVIKGDLVPEASAILAFDLASNAKGTGYDFVSEAGSTPLALGGCTLQVNLAGGFVPSNSQSFTLLTSNQSITGAFGNVDSGSRLATADGGGTFLVTYVGNSVVIGDFQATPSSNSFAAWMAGFFPGVTDPAIVGTSADPDGDGVRNLLEFAFKGAPGSATSHGLSRHGFLTIDGTAAPQFVLVTAFRQGAVFLAQADGSQANETTVDSLRCTVQGGNTLDSFNQPMLHSGPSATAPAGFNLPDLSGSGWEYHIFYRNPAATGPRLFIRAGVETGP